LNGLWRGRYPFSPLFSCPNQDAIIDSRPSFDDDQ
jgi:hypothetical protein